MKRLVAVGLVLATVAVTYAIAGDRLGLGGLFDWPGSGQRLPALRSGDLPFRYPARLWHDGIEGEVVLRIHITEAGSVDSVRLERSSGHTELDDIALQGATRLKYHPATRGEEPVAMWALLPVRFERQESAPPVEGN